MCTDFPTQFTQGANLITNIPHNLTEAGRTVAMVIRRALDGGYREVEVAPEAQEAWLALLLTGMGNLIGSPDCTPSYYNSEGQPLGPAARLKVGYPAGPSGLFQIPRRMAQIRSFRRLGLYVNASTQGPEDHLPALVGPSLMRQFQSRLRGRLRLN
jgi:hypothetical protein